MNRRTERLRAVASCGACDGSSGSNLGRVLGGILERTPAAGLLFMFAFLPQFADQGSVPIWSQLLMLEVIQNLAGVASLGFVAVASGTVGGWLPPLARSVDVAEAADGVSYGRPGRQAVRDSIVAPRARGKVTRLASSQTSSSSG